MQRVLINQGAKRLDFNDIYHFSYSGFFLVRHDDGVDVL